MNRRGFTLIEIVLALGLVVVLLGLLGTALSIHIRLADASRGELEGSQAAQHVLRRIADDLRNAIPMTSLPYVMGGVVGDSRELQVETSRMPLLRSGGNQTRETYGEDRLGMAPPSDVRTVHYRIAAADNPTELAAFSSAELQQRGGLIRIECERAALAWMIERGDTADLEHMSTLLSVDVETIEFTYYDGEAAYDEWDSLERGKLPTAVRVAVAMRRPQREFANSSSTAAPQEPPPTIYERTVYLPNFRSTMQRTLAELSGQLITTTSDKSKSAEQ